MTGVDTVVADMLSSAAERKSLVLRILREEDCSEGCLKKALKALQRFNDAQRKPIPEGRKGRKIRND